MKRAFLTGGTGFIGFNLARRLVDEDWHVTVLHRESSSLKYLSSLPFRFTGCSRIATTGWWTTGGSTDEGRFPGIF